MPVNLFSRYRNQPTLEIQHTRRGQTFSLPLRRSPPPPVPRNRRQHRFASYDTLDAIALKYLSREDLYWHVLDANDGRLPDDYSPGEQLNVPPLSTATRVDRPIL